MQRVHKVLTIHAFDYYKSSTGQFVPTPCIRLQGKWVARLGFKSGDKMEVICKDGLILVRLAKQE